LNYKFLEQENLFVAEGAASSINYSDHEQESLYIYESIKNSTDKGSTSRELNNAIQDWPSRAHLSPLRGNLLRPFQKLLSGRVLEVGAGCGAISRVLGELGGAITSLEPSFPRAKIAAERVRDLKNVEIYCESLSRFERKESFDAVVVVGVLEYAVSSGDFSSFEQFLERCRAFLKPSGVLILAIENKLGIKYLAGTREDHLGAQYVGVNDAYSESGVRTFSRTELLGLLKRAEFSHFQEYAPFPDYKFPVAILNGEALKDQRLDPGTVFQGILSKDPQVHAEEQSFSLERSFQLFARNGNTLDVANSFLVVASREPLEASTELAYFFSTELKPQFQKQTKIVRTEDGALQVAREHLFPKLVPVSGCISQVLEEGRFISGRLWSEGLLEIVNRPNWCVQDLVPWVRTWVSALHKEFSLLPDSQIALKSKLVPEALDATPFNFLDSEKFFDLEWRWFSEVELGWILVRGLFHSLVRISSVEVPAEGVPLTILALIEELAAQLSLSFSKEDLNRYLAMENEFLREALGVTNLLTDSDIYTLHIRENSCAEPTAQHLVKAMVKSRFEEFQNNASAEECLDVLQREHLALKKSLSASQVALEELAAREQAIATERDQALSKIKALEEQIYRTQNLPQKGIIEKIKPTLSELEKRYPVRSASKLIKKNFELVESSGLFSEEFYLRKYPDVKGLSALEHYLRIGASEGRQPNIFFSPEYYLNQYPDVRALYMNPFLHFLEHGAREMRSPSALFDSRYYLTNNPDIMAAGINPLRHFIQYGWREGRNPHPLFDVSFYISRYSDVRDTGKNPLEHYIEFGGFEGRRPNREFDSGFYLTRYPDVKRSGLNPLEHYIAFGLRENRRTRALGEELQEKSAERISRALSQRPDALPTEAGLKAQNIEIPQRGILVTEPMGISVVMPTFNRVELLADTIEKCRRVEGDLPLEYIVIDDGSSDGTAEYLEAQSKVQRNLSFKILKNGGPGRARNIGASMAKQEIVLFLGDDIQPLGDTFFKTHMQLHERTRYRNFGVLGKVIWPWLPSEKFTFVMGHIQGHGGEQFGYADLVPYKFLDWRFFYTCNVSVKRTIVDDWNSEGFSPAFPFAAFEDSEFAYRMSKKRDGFFLYYDPTSLGAHRHEYDAEGFINRQQKAGMMASVLLGMHPELADQLYLSPFVQALRSKTSAVRECNGADYRTFIEGTKAFMRIIARQSLLGTQSWHDAVLAATFGASFLQGMMMNWNEPDANFSAGYEFIFKTYFDRIRDELHVAFGDVARGAIDSVMSHSEPAVFLN